MHINDIIIGRRYLYTCKEGNPQPCRVKTILRLPGVQKIDRGRATTFSPPKRSPKQLKDKIVVKIHDIRLNKEFGVNPKKLICPE